MRDNWDKDLPSEGLKAKVDRKVCVFFFAWTAETRSTFKVVLFIFRIGPGVGVGVGAGVGVDQEPGVGVGTAPPRLRTPASPSKSIDSVTYFVKTN